MGESIKTTDERQLEEYRQIFALFDTDRDGQVASTELGNVLRAVGLLPSEAELAELKESFGNKESFSHSDLTVFISKLPAVDPQALRAALLDAFHVFDQSSTGQIGTRELRHIMTSLGEKLGDDEANEMIKMADPTNSGVIQYDQFVEKLIAK